MPGSTGHGGRGGGGRGWSLTCCLALVCAATAGCGAFGSVSVPSNGPDTALGKSCADIIGKATKVAAALRSYHFTARLTDHPGEAGGGSGAPGRETMKESGDVARGSTLRYKMSVRIGSSDPSIAGSFAATIVVIGHDYYMKPNAAWGSLLKLAYAKERKDWKPWLLSEHGSLSDKVSSGLMGPERVLKAMAGSGTEFGYHGHETVGGVVTTHCSGTGTSQGHLRGELWIDGAGRLVKYRSETDDSHGMLTYSAFDKPVTIARPPAGQVHRVK